MAKAKAKVNVSPFRSGSGVSGILAAVCYRKPSVSAWTARRRVRVHLVLFITLACNVRTRNLQRAFLCESSPGRIAVYQLVNRKMRRMCSPGFTKGFLYLFVLGLVLSTRDVLASSEANSTEVAAEDALFDEDDDDSLSDITLDEFKERYRRLIPYMTFYVANNYVNAQGLPPQSNFNDAPSAAALRKPQLSLSRPNTAPRRGILNDYRINIPYQDKKFIPSVQFDPRNIGGDNDYFTPVRYNTKVNYEDYASPLQGYQTQKAAYPEITTASSQTAHKENRYFANLRPLRPYSTNTRDHFPRKQPGKPAQATIQDDYLLDYVSRPSGNTAMNYPSKDFEGTRYIPAPASSSHSNGPMKILDSFPPRQTATIPQVLRHSNLNLNHIVESFQLSERLPEMLNRDNLDTSIKTLVEILNLLHSKKKNEYPLMQAPPLPSPIQQQASAPRYPQKVLNYHNFKSRPPTRPKVITESRFQATPSPLLITDDPERYMGAYAEDAKLKEPVQHTYNPDNMGNDKMIEYYTPYIQDIPEENKQVYNPTVKPQIDGSSTQHSYEITEDLSDDILQDERFTLPISTESSNSYEEPNEIPPPQKPSVPKPSIKYGATRGKPSVDYPAYATIPQTDFSCKEQRYKGFFGDPATGCQVWHYCDLNGGKSSFLCPNGTIFSQVALTCDWWFNVKCETTKQLYVLNERLYKYILPIMPKFPEDFTGPEVDRYLEIKFKEMEAKLKEKKRKKQQEEKEKLKNKQQTVKEDQ